MARLSHWPLAVVCLALVSSAGTVQFDTGCTPQDMPPIGREEFKCKAPTSIYLVRALAMTTFPDGRCPSGWEFCPLGLQSKCCGPTERACGRDLGNVDLAALVFSAGCWGRLSCPVTWPGQENYLGVQYLCLTGSQTGTFSVNLNLESSAMALQTTPQPSGTPLLQCLVETPNNTPARASVLLVKAAHRSDSECCTSLRVNEEPWLQCLRNGQYQRYNNLMTPFSVWLRVDRGNDAEARTVVYAQNSETLRMSCKEGDASASPCSNGTNNTPLIVGVAIAVVVALVATALAVFYSRRARLSSRPTQPGADNSAYSCLSDLTRVQPRTQADYAPLGHSRDVSRRDRTPQPGEDNHDYSSPYYLTPIHSGNEAEETSGLNTNTDASIPEYLVILPPINPK